MAPRKTGHPNEQRTFLENGVFNQTEFLGTAAMGGGHGDMRNAGGMHAKMMRNQQVKKPQQGASFNFDDFVQQDMSAKIAAREAANRPDAKKVKQMVGPGKLAPMIDTGGGRKARMVVGVRVRPLSAKEARKGNHDALEVTAGQNVFAHDPDDKMGGLDYLRLNVTKDKAYTFDHAFGPECTSEDVYNKTMRGVVAAVMQGFHGSCFAYGATGSGKTFTMAGTQEAPGVMPRAISDLFKIAKQSDDLSWSFKVTYVEIYNERIKDLLNPGQADLDVRECPKRGNVVAGAVEVGVNSLMEIMELMSKGTMYRTTEATNCNEVSSRSHAVLQISCVGVDRYKDPRSAKKQQARLSMIDLAGSERAYKTDNTGQRLREGRNINRSLLSLANCINALADKSKKVSHIPYRDSKLTRLLRDSLSGTSVSAMICNVSPSSDQFEETLNTLKYANRAKQMSPPSVPQRNVRDMPHPADEKMEVLKELKESLIPMMKQISTPKQPLQQQQQAKGGKKGNNKAAEAKENAAEQRNARDERAERRNASKRGEASEADDGDVRARRLSAAASEAASAATAAVASNDTANMAEVRKALEEVCEAEPEAKSNPAVQAAYVALDNMEGEEMEAISAESALLYKEQHALVREIAKSKHALKLAAVRLAWYDAAPDHVAEEEEVPGEDNVGGGKEDLEALQARYTEEEANLSRLRKELQDNKAAVTGLTAEIPERIVSSQRLSQLKLVMKHQQAATDSLRFKQQARSAAGLMAEVLGVWDAAIPEELSELLLEVFDLPAAAKEGRSIDTVRKGTLESGREAPTPATDLAKANAAKAKKAAPAKAAKKPVAAANRKPLPAEAYDSPAEEEEDGEEEEDDDEEPHVLNSEGVATPWRTLGSLAQRVATPHHEDDGEEEEEEEEEMEVVRKAHAELKDARTRRLSVMKMVEQAATPKPRKTRSAAVEQGMKAAAAAAQPPPREAWAEQTKAWPPAPPPLPLDESRASIESASLPASPRVGERRNTRAAAAYHRAPLSERTHNQADTRKPAAVKGANRRPASGRPRARV